MKGREEIHKQELFFSKKEVSSKKELHFPVCRLKESGGEHSRRGKHLPLEKKRKFLGSRLERGKSLELNARNGSD